MEAMRITRVSLGAPVRLRFSCAFDTAKIEEGLIRVNGKILAQRETDID